MFINVRSAFIIEINVFLLFLISENYKNEENALNTKREIVFSQ